MSIRVLPFSAGFHAGALAGGGFVILDFPIESSEPTMVYSEGLTGAAYLEKESESATHRWAYEDISRQCLDVTASRKLLVSVAREYER